MLSDLFHDAWRGFSFDLGLIDQENITGRGALLIQYGDYGYFVIYLTEVLFN